jgi:hypothetical protein
MKRSMSILSTLILALSLASCTFLDDLLSINFFAESMELSASDVQNLSISELLVKSDSNAFFKAVKADTDVKTAILGITAGVIHDEAATPRAVQEAGILGANVLIYTSPAGDLLANAAKLVDGVEEGATMDEVLALILPTSIYSGGVVVNASAFLTMITAFEQANAYFVALGDSLAEGSGEYATSVANAGDIAMGAFICAVLDNLVVPGGGDLGQYLLDALNGEPVDAVEFDIPNDPYLEAILNAANLGSLLDL